MVTDGTGSTIFSYHPVDGSTFGAGNLASINGPLADDTITHTYDLNEPTRHPMALAMPTHFKNEIHAASRLRNSFSKTLKESIWRSYSHDSLLGALNGASSPTSH
jgi:hypothetical protein